MSASEHALVAMAVWEVDLSDRVLTHAAWVGTRTRPARTSLEIGFSHQLKAA
jgi:hypothetical protein